MNYLEKVLEQKELLISMRRYLHEHPEISGREENTIRYVGEKLKEFGIPYDVIENGGVLGYIDSGKPGKTLLLRADCDALPMDESDSNEKFPKACVSSVKGAAHTCGHDFNTSSALLSAKILNESKDEWCGKVVLFIERSEENMGVYQHNLLNAIFEKNIQIDGGWACHVNVGPSGIGTLIKGPSHAGSMAFTYRIQGKGGHGARPYQAYNPIPCFQAIAAAIDQFRMTKLDPYSPCTLTICSVNSGHAANVIPDELTFSGNIRFFDREHVGLKAKEELSKVVHSICESYHCSVAEEILRGPGIPNINNVTCADFAEKVLTETFGKDRIVIGQPSMGSESFAYVSSLWPSVLLFFGIYNAEKGITYGIHHPKFEIDEETAHWMTAYTLAYAVAFTGSEFEVNDYKFLTSPEQLFEV